MSDITCIIIYAVVLQMRGRGGSRRASTSCCAGAWPWPRCRRRARWASSQPACQPPPSRAQPSWRLCQRSSPWWACTPDAASEPYALGSIPHILIHETLVLPTLKRMMNGGCMPADASGPSDAEFFQGGKSTPGVQLLRTCICGARVEKAFVLASIPWVQR